MLFCVNNLMLESFLNEKIESTTFISWTYWYWCCIQNTSMSKKDEWNDRSIKIFKISQWKINIRFQDIRFQNILQKMFWNANEIWEKHSNLLISPALFIFPGSCCNLHGLCNSWIYSFKKEILCERLDMWIRVNINMGLLTTTF